MVAKGAPESGTVVTGRSLSALTAGTLRRRAWAPATDSTPRHTWRASSAVMPERE
jgi:hypothetical protein